MKPYVYVKESRFLGRKGERQLFSSLEKLVKNFCKTHVGANGFKNAFLAFYEDETQVEIDPHKFMREIALDLDAIRREAEEMIEKDKKSKAETVSLGFSSDPWLCDYGLEFVMNRLVDSRKWVMIPFEEINLTEIEKSLEK